VRRAIDRALPKIAVTDSIVRYLSYCWQTAYGIRLSDDLPGHRREGEGTVNGRAHDKLYVQCKTWVEGGSINF